MSTRVIVATKLWNDETDKYTESRVLWKNVVNVVPFGNEWFAIIQALPSGNIGRTKLQSLFGVEEILIEEGTFPDEEGSIEISTDTRLPPRTTEEGSA